MPKYTCEHKVCTVVSTGGLRFECRTKAKLQEHSRFRSYHPCCKDQSNLCPTGKKIKEWREGTSIVCKVASPVYYLCPHVSCDKRYHKKNNYDNHMKTMHQCMEDCEACGKKVEDENRMEEENNYADKRRKEHLAAHDLEREVWKEHQKQKQEMELRGEHSSSIDALIEDLDKGEYDLCLPEVLDIPDIPLSLNQDDYIPIPNEKYFDIPINGTVVRMETVPNNEKPKACIAGCGFLGLVYLINECKIIRI